MTAIKDKHARTSSAKWLIFTIVTSIVMLSSSLAADVVINMPAPKPAKTAAAPAAATSSATAPVGDLALKRYARARSGAYDTYQVGGRYAGMRYYGHPWFGWGFPGFSFPHCGNFSGNFSGNRFIGFVGRSHACAPVKCVKAVRH
jgi:hypothetical protein